jgi:endo-1,4-beta-xylanase
LPDWVNAITDKDILTSVLQTHVTKVVSHFKGLIPVWNVVNEPLQDDGSIPLSVFYDLLDQDFITIAVQAARAADPDAILIINNDCKLLLSFIDT